MSAQKKTINLLPQNKLEKSPLGKFLKWGLSFGRYIIVFIELIAIVVFISRFKLDQNLGELEKEIQKKQTIITASAELEKEVRFTQKKLILIQSLEPQLLGAASLIEELSAITPLDVYFSDLKLDKESCSFAGSSSSNAGLSSFLNHLQSSPSFEEIDLKSVASGGQKDNNLKFEISAKLAKKG